MVNASVVVEYLVGLQLAPQATGFFRGLKDSEPIELWAPELIYIEVASALRKLAAGKVISASAGRRAIQWLVQLPIRSVGTRKLLLDAWDLREAITPSDAVYTLLARELACPLMTADARLARAARRAQTPLRRPALATAALTRAAGANAGSDARP